MTATPPSPQIVRILWVAFMAALVVYGALAFAVLKPAAPHPQLRWILLALAAVSGGELAVALGSPGLLAGRAESYQQACIIRWAFIEAVGVYGLLVRILGASMAASGAFIIVALAGLALSGPSEDARRQFEQQKQV